MGNLDEKQGGDKQWAFEINNITKAIRDLKQNIVDLANRFYVTGFGDWATKVVGTTYLAETDGFVVVIVTHGINVSIDCYGYTDSNSTPTTERGYASDFYSDNAGARSFTMPVKRGDYWKTSQNETGGTVVVYWIPLNR